MILPWKRKMKVPVPSMYNSFGKLLKYLQKNKLLRKENR